MKLSLIIAAYNAEKFIEETLESALSQTLDSTEIVVVNDCSTDGTLALVNEYLKYPNIRVYDLKLNGGAAKAYNYGVIHSQGEYLTFLDSDDLYMPLYGERVLAEMEAVGADIGFSNYYGIDGYVRSEKTLYGVDRHSKYVNAFGGAGLEFPNGNWKAIRRLALQIDGVNISPRAIYRRELFYNFGLDDIRLKISNDWLRNVSFVLNGAKCVYVDEVLGYYRFHPGGNSQKDPLANLVDIVKCYEILTKEYAKLLSADELTLINLSIQKWRKNLFELMAMSNASTNQIVHYLVDAKF